MSHLGERWFKRCLIWERGGLRGGLIWQRWWWPQRYVCVCVCVCVQFAVRTLFQFACSIALVQACILETLFVNKLVSSVTRYAVSQPMVYYRTDLSQPMVYYRTDLSPSPSPSPNP